ncbi:hypothetical protein CLD22_12110 [Rubrivivax gelatinosus]|nr:hypothetical protein [Rubrivivax gelatinosus]
MALAPADRAGLVCKPPTSRSAPTRSACIRNFRRRDGAADGMPSLAGYLDFGVRPSSLPSVGSIAVSSVSATLIRRCELGGEFSGRNASPGASRCPSSSMRSATGAESTPAPSEAQTKRPASGGCSTVRPQRCSSCSTTGRACASRLRSCSQWRRYSPLDRAL